MKFASFALLSFAASVAGQDDLSGIDPALIITPPAGLDLPGCYKDMLTGDINGDGFIRKGEYLRFVQEYALNRKCLVVEELTLQQKSIFNALACLCEDIEGSSPSCCLGSNARIPTEGAQANAIRTQENELYLTATCVWTDATLDGECPPEVLNRATPPPVIITPVNLAAADTGGGLSDGAKWAIIAAAIALLLLLCCCCCVFRRKRKKELEEEEEERRMAMAKAGGDDVEQAPEQYPVAAAAPRAGPPADEEDWDGDNRNRSGGAEPDEDWDGEGRRRRGQNFADEEDPEDTRRIRGYGELPPENKNNEQVNLRSPPPKDPEDDPDWDYPGRDIDYPKPDPDEYSAQEFEPYVPDGGVHIPQHPPRDPIEPPNRDWQRGKPEIPDEIDQRKHRIQAGLGEGEVWDKLNDDEQSVNSKGKGGAGDVFDWVVQSALGVLDKSDEAGHLDDEPSTAVP